MNNENTKKELLEKIMDKAVLAGVLGIVAFVVTAKAMRFITHSKMVTMLFLIGSVIGVCTCIFAGGCRTVRNALAA